MLYYGLFLRAQSPFIFWWMAYSPTILYYWLLLSYDPFFFQTEDIINLHSKVCPNSQKNENKSLQLSVDGVSESKSSTVSIDVYSSKFNKCRSIYPHRIVRPLKKGFVNNKEQLRNFVFDITANETTIDSIVADNLKRAVMKGCLNHAAMFPCEYCFAKGVQITVKAQKSDSHIVAKNVIIEKIKRIQNLKDPDSKNTVKLLKQILKDLEKTKEKRSKKHIVWPASTANKELRSKEKILEIVSKIDNQESDDNDPPSKEDLKGVVDHSVLLDIEGFDFVNGFPTEYMHLVCLGVVKRLTELTFNVGLNRSRNTKRKLSSTKMFNDLMSQTKVVFEFSRRSRDLDFSVFKAEEFRNLILFFFPHVLACIETGAKERELWLYLAFMTRSCTIPDSEYFNGSISKIAMACEKFYKIYEKTFGATNCTYSIHVLCCHLLQVRLLGPLTETSAFKFESFYGEIRNAFYPGTPSTLKQILENIYLRRSLCSHSCEKSIHLANYETARQDDTLVYTYTDGRYQIYKIIDEKDDDVICNPQGTFACEFSETPELSWSSVGVFKKGATSKEIIKVPHKSIAGKVLKVGLYLITCPENILKEK